MRKMTMDQLDQIIKEKGTAANRAALRYRGTDDAKQMNKGRPRSQDEIRILDKLAKQSLREAIDSGMVIYDKERRVLIFDEFINR